MADSYAQAADALKLLVDTVYAPEEIVCRHDELHESLGWDGIYVGVAPLREAPMPNNRLVKTTLLHVQFFGLWEKEVDPGLEVDPRIITGYHARLLDAIEAASITVAGALWYFQWEGTEYPRDPVGNKTRYVAQIRAWSNNNSVIETTG